ncbi:MAG TPA: DNA polymerase III subunit delta' [Candidatus Kryptonia bacterium]|nr:DNA polymerase III subunit delta' [Candidatus Kryptonia bacterium]
MARADAPVVKCGFAAVRGQEQATAQLRSALQRERLAHAVLITGPEGVGKQLLARALTAFIACEAPLDDACGECAGCRQVAAGSHPDVRVVGVPDGKKDIRIEPIRELRGFMQLTPLRAPRKVALILDAHALNGNAQNALLKTLEEPPPRSLLLLVTHAPGALLPTVRSRCQRIQCAPLSDDVVADILEHDCQIPAVEAALAAAYAEGSPGRALQMRYALGERRRALLGHLAALPCAGYVSMTQMIRDMTERDEPALPLTLVLTWYRDLAVQAVGARGVGLHNADLLAEQPQLSAESAVRAADAVTAALARLRRGNPNRQLLLEALLLHLRDAR